MSRVQTFEAQSQLTLTTGGTLYQLTSVPVFAKSVIVQSDPANTDYVLIGNASTQTMAISPSQAYIIDADALDLGGGGKIDLSTIRVKSATSAQKVNWSYLGGI